LPVIAPTIITAVEDSASLIDFYEHAYSSAGEDGELYARWRRLGAIGKADHVVALCRRAGIAPRTTLDVGCGDGALLAELSCRSFAETLDGAEISEHAVQLARSRPELGKVVRFDGEKLPFEDGTYEMGVISHVLEHVPRPSSLLAEVARVCRAVVIEVPLEANLSARRAAKREHAHEIGHLQRLDRDAARQIVQDAGLRVAAELDDALPLAAQRFFAGSPLATASAFAKWALRTILHRAAPPLARRLFTVHYACLCLPPGA
jgi:ubiquinone/menaquinone biosynthesis C-methylase UbiE